MFNGALRNVCRSLHRAWSNGRYFSSTGALRNFDGDGKTTVNVLNNEADLGLMINGFSQVGFRLNNDLTVLGPMAIFPRSVLSWNVKDVDEITEDSLSLFTVLEPKIDILVIGVGNKLHDLSVYKRLHPFSIKHKINFEVLPTEQACSTFNFLNSEGRSVAAALLPPRTSMQPTMTSRDPNSVTKIYISCMIKIYYPVYFFFLHNTCWMFGMSVEGI